MLKKPFKANTSLITNLFVSSEDNASDTDFVFQNILDIESLTNINSVIDFESIEYKHGKTQSGEIIGPKTDLTIAFDNFKENASEKQLDSFDIFTIIPFIPTQMKTKKGLIEFSSFISLIYQ